VNRDPYVYAGTGVLRNKLGITDAAELDAIERQLVVQRTREGLPDGDFDLAHLCAIHRQLFQDLYEWAGQLRTVEISKGAQQFQFRRYIVTGIADIHRRLVDGNYLKGLGTTEFCQEAARIIGDINYAHPFREGNGRTQLQYLDQLAKQAEHPIDIAQLQPRDWIEASRGAHNSDYEAMSTAIFRALA
jgi:cell filamentation protein